MTYWVYKLTYDTGAAPHARGGLLSLAICKPRIREGAVVGDVIFGFSGRSRRVNRGKRLIYVAEVTEKMARPGEYYERPQYRGRWDCIYERVRDRLAWRPGSLTHAEGKFRAKDLGPAPRYHRAVVLLSDQFRYLGIEGTMDHAGKWPNLATFVHEMGIGERELEPQSEMGRMLTELKRDLWRTRSAKEVGEPTEPPSDEPAWGSAVQRAGASKSCAPRSRASGDPPRPTGGCG